MQIVREYIEEMPAILVGLSVVALAMLGYAITTEFRLVAVYTIMFLIAYLVGHILKWVLRVTTATERDPNTTR